MFAVTRFNRIFGIIFLEFVCTLCYLHKRRQLYRYYSTLTEVIAVYTYLHNDTQARTHLYVFTCIQFARAPIHKPQVEEEERNNEVSAQD